MHIAAMVGLLYTFSRPHKSFKEKVPLKSKTVENIICFSALLHSIHDLSKKETRPRLTIFSTLIDAKNDSY